VKQFSSCSYTYYSRRGGASRKKAAWIEIHHEYVLRDAGNQSYTISSRIPGDDYLINFRKGDPFSKIDQGYARLPGAGYEAIHPELKEVKPENYPDIYRLSILADIAPYSREYNLSRQAVAKQAQNNTQLRIEYEKILERVKQTKESAIQMANRHFTAPTEQIQGTISSVSPAGITFTPGFSVLGDNKNYARPRGKPRHPRLRSSSELIPAFLCRLFSLSLSRRRVFALSFCLGLVDRIYSAAGLRGHFQFMLSGSCPLVVPWSRPDYRTAHLICCRLPASGSLIVDSY
jgi:hypothetical protein